MTPENDQVLLMVIDTNGFFPVPVTCRDIAICDGLVAENERVFRYVSPSIDVGFRSPATSLLRFVGHEEIFPAFEVELGALSRTPHTCAR